MRDTVSPGVTLLLGDPQYGKHWHLLQHHVLIWRNRSAAGSHRIVLRVQRYPHVREICRVPGLDVSTNEIYVCEVLFRVTNVMVGNSCFIIAMGTSAKYMDLPGG